MDLTDPAPLRDDIAKKINDLFDFNQRVVSVLREQAGNFEMIAGFFGVQQQRALEISHAIVELSAIASTNTTNIIVAEYGSTEDLIDLGGEIDDDEEPPSD